MRDNIASTFNRPRAKSALWLPVLAVAVFAYAVAAPAEAKPPPGTFVIFDVPGGAFDTFVEGINPAGAVTGYTFDGTVFLGFVRAPNGTVTTIAVPGSAATFVGSSGASGPPINPAGAIAGSYADLNGVMHGFVRALDGTFAMFDAPNSVNGTDFVCCITPVGSVAGISFDAKSVGHGFLRAPNGTFAVFDPPGSTATAPLGMNPAEAITGYYLDASSAFHGFLRARDGTIATFVVPGAAGGTTPVGINPPGAIVGSYFDVNFMTHGFLRAADGTFTTFDPPGATFTFPLVINPAGAIAGYYYDGSRIMASCARGMAVSPQWTRRALQPLLSGALTRRGSLREITPMQQVERRMASYSSRISG